MMLKPKRLMAGDTVGLVAPCYGVNLGDAEEPLAQMEQMEALAKTLADACDERAAQLLQSGLRVALCGQPNVGKSSLLNALLGEEKAICTPPRPPEWRTIRLPPYG